MITSQTIRTPLVVKPHGRCSLYVVNGTQFLAHSTLDTGLLIDPELLVSDEVLVVVAANHVGIGKRNTSFYQFLDTWPAFCYDLADMFHSLTGFLDFLACFLVSVQMKKRESDVRLRHDNGKTCISMQALLTQLLFEDTHRIAHIVATGGKGVDV